MVDYLRDLRPEYTVMIPYLKERFYELHPNGDEVACRRYVQSQILRAARHMVNFRQLDFLLSKKSVSVREILQTHKSWRERPDKNSVFEQLDSTLRTVNSLLDVGCGLTPIWILCNYPKIKHYICIEPDKRVEKRLRLLCEKFCAGRTVIISNKVSSIRDTSITGEHVDLVLVQKVIPMLYRKHNQITTNSLSSLRFKYMLITGSKRSLSRISSIENLERKALLDFIERSSFHIVRSVEDMSEFGYLIKGEKYEQYHR